jgi:hypothetical protein
MFLGLREMDWAEGTLQVLEWGGKGFGGGESGS